MKHLSDYKNDAQTALFNETGAFFAFGKKQFDEKRKEGVTYVDMGAGLVAPKENAKRIHDEIDAIERKAIEADVKENGATKIIHREYFNYESQLIGDTTNAREALAGHIEMYPDLFAPEVLRSEFENCFLLACDNNWF
jgi:hypothetical protein